MQETAQQLGPEGQIKCRYGDTASRRHCRERKWGSSLVDQQVKDPPLSILCLWLQLWHGFDPWPGELPHDVGMAEKKIKVGR